MKTYDQQLQRQSRTLDANPKASHQASWDVILQKYKDKPLQFCGWGSDFFVGDKMDDAFEEEYIMTRQEMDEQDEKINDNENDDLDPNYEIAYRRLYGNFWKATVDAVLTPSTAAPDGSGVTRYYCANKNCRYSPVPLKRYDNSNFITIDHKIPVIKHARGEAPSDLQHLSQPDFYNCIRNLQPLCNHCNSSKGGR